MKLSSRPELLNDANLELKKIRKSLKNGVIDESSRLDEFSPLGKLDTVLEIYTSGITDSFMSKFIQPSKLKELKEKVEEEIKRIRLSIRLDSKMANNANIKFVNTS